MKIFICFIFMVPWTMDSTEKEAIKTGLPVMVFRNCEPIPGPWFIYIPKCEDKEQLIIVNIVKDGKLVFRAWVAPGQGAEQVIYNVLR